MIITLAICCFGLAALCGTVRLLVGPRLGDRIMALDVLLISLMGGISVDAARRGETTYMILPIVIAIIGFTATVAAARFLEHQAPPTSIDVDPNTGPGSGSGTGTGAEHRPGGGT